MPAPKTTELTDAVAMLRRTLSSVASVAVGWTAATGDGMIAVRGPRSMCVTIASVVADKARAARGDGGSQNRKITIVSIDTAIDRLSVMIEANLVEGAVLCWIDKNDNAKVGVVGPRIDLLALVYRIGNIALTMPLED